MPIRNNCILFIAVACVPAWVRGPSSCPPARITTCQIRTKFHILYAKCKQLCPIHNLRVPMSPHPTEAHARRCPTRRAVLSVHLPACANYGQLHPVHRRAVLSVHLPVRAAPGELRSVLRRGRAGRSARRRRRSAGAPLAIELEQGFRRFRFPLSSFCGLKLLQFRSIPEALEAVKIAARVGTVMSRRLLLLDGAAGSVHIVKLRGRWRERAVVQS
jgi:hypothetical protein